MLNIDEHIKLYILGTSTVFYVYFVERLTQRNSWP